MKARIWAEAPELITGALTALAAILVLAVAHV
jgi:hypothetical protein